MANKDDNTLAATLIVLKMVELGKIEDFRLDYRKFENGDRRSIINEIKYIREALSEDGIVNDLNLHRLLKPYDGLGNKTVKSVTKCLKDNGLVVKNCKNGFVAKRSYKEQ